jgi:Fic/DOC family
MDALDSKPLGYAWLAERFGIVTMPHWKESRSLSKGARRLIERDGRVIEYLPSTQDPGDEVFEQLEFALRREGLNLELLRKILIQKVDRDAMTAYIRTKPTGRNARILWFFYEILTKTQLDLPDLKQGNYVDLLDQELYVTGPVRKIKRQRLNDNLLGTVHFSPIVRWKGLPKWDETEMKDRCASIVSDYPPEVFSRAVRYLYAKESKSSHEIERETPNQKRAEAFISLLEQAWHRNFLKKEALVELQRAIVDPRFANKGWRSEIGEQVYVGESLAPDVERVHFAGPKPEDLEELMNGFLKMSNLITEKILTMESDEKSRILKISGGVSTLVSASVISFAFNFLHPFSDGNGRIHRFLLHHVLAHNHFGPEGIILPISAVILNRPREYDQALESFSKPLMERVEYLLDDRLRMTVTNDTADFYRYIDLTEPTRIMIEFIRETIETELPAELRFLTAYDAIRRDLREIVELPDRIADLFVKLCHQNGGSLSKKKRELPEFAPLTDPEIASLEAVVRNGLGIVSE